MVHAVPLKKKKKNHNFLAGTPPLHLLKSHIYFVFLISVRPLTSHQLLRSDSLRR